jgi:hypothetical protein
MEQKVIGKKFLNNQIIGNTSFSIIKLSIQSVLETVFSLFPILSQLNGTNQRQLKAQQQQKKYSFFMHFMLENAGDDSFSSPILFTDVESRYTLVCRSKWIRSICQNIHVCVHDRI